VAHPYWPLFDLRLRTERLELRLPTDDDIGALVEAIDAGVHDPATMPFNIPWTDAEPVARRRSAAQHWWGQRASWQPDDWKLGLAVVVDGRPVGVQDLFATGFPVLRQFHTGSWLTRSVQGRGIGREMRAAVLHLGFAGLGAEAALSCAFADNPASLAVSRALGYEENGRGRAAPRGEVREQVSFRLTREAWAATPRIDVEVEGLDGCLDLFGLAPPPA
jgi:RimJ/RimL family protein N-acetyltransferase